MNPRDRALDGRPTDGDWCLQATAPTALGDAIVTGEVFLRLIPLLAAQGVKLVALRCTGFNNLDLAAAKGAETGDEVAGEAAAADDEPVNAAQRLGQPESAASRRAGPAPWSASASTSGTRWLATSARRR